MKNDVITKTITMTAENYDRCKNIADELYDLVTKLYKNFDGDWQEVLTDDDGYYYLEHDGVLYCEKGHSRYYDDGVEDLDTLEDFTVWDYVNDVLDIKYTIDSDREYFGVRLLVAFGGPNIYIDTVSGKVELYWWSDYAEYPLDRCVIEEIDNVFSEYYSCL